MAVSEERFRRRRSSLSSEQRRSRGQEEEGGETEWEVGVRGGVEELKQVEKKMIEKISFM